MSKKQQLKFTEQCLKNTNIILSEGILNADWMREYTLVANKYKRTIQSLQAELKINGGK